MKIVWLVLGLALVAIGIVGIVTPLLPTTPFLLLAADSLSRSSPRLEAWLLEHPRLGPPIRSWRRHGAISRRAKLLALATMISAPVVSMAMAVPPWVIAIQCGVLVGAAAFVVSRPEPRAPMRRAG